MSKVANSLQFLVSILVKYGYVSAQLVDEVKTWNDPKGYGFIMIEGQDDVRVIQKGSTPRALGVHS